MQIALFKEKEKKMDKTDMTNNPDNSQVQPNVETADSQATQPQAQSQAISQEIGKQEDTFTKGIDPETLAPELKQLYKSMQADYTRSKQQIKADLDELSNWRGLRQTKEFQEWAEQVRKQQAEQAKPKPESEMTEEEKLEAKFQEYKQQIDQQYQPFIKQSIMEKAQATLEKFLVANPEAKSKLEDISNVIAQYNLPIDMAWKIVKSETAKNDAKQDVLSELQVKKDANLNMPSLQPSKPDTNRPKSIFDAYQQAKRDLENK